MEEEEEAYVASAKVDRKTKKTRKVKKSDANQSTSDKSRKQILKKLSTGQKISLSPQEDRMLKTAFDYLAGI